MLWVPTYLLSYPLRGKIDEDLRALGGNAMEKMTNAQWWVSTLLQAAACESKQSPDKRQNHIHLFSPLFEFVCLSHPPVCLFSSEYVFSYRLCDFLVKMTIIPAVSWRIIQHDQRIVIIPLIRLNYHNLFINDIKARSELQRPPLVASFFLKGALIATDDQESSFFHRFFIFFSVLANFLWRNDNRKGSRSQSGRCDSGPGGHACDTVQRLHVMSSWRHPRRGWVHHLVAKMVGTGKKICLLWWVGHSTALLEWRGQLKAHHQAHDPQSQPGNVCDSLSFPVLVTHILNPCIHLLLRHRPLILNQLHHCCRALFIHLFRPMFIYCRPIRGLHVSVCKTVKPVHTYEYCMLYDLYSMVKTCCHDFFYLKLAPCVI